MHMNAYAKQKQLQLYATYCAVIDSTNGRVLYEKNGEQAVPMASTTKILTCIVLLEEGNLEDYAEVSSYAASMPQVRMGAQKGEYYKVEDLLYSLMLESHNDAAVILAEYLCKDVDTFAQRLNKKAAEIGCINYHFVTPNGLDDTDEGGEHCISAIDLAKIMAYCTLHSPKKEKFLEITRSLSYTVNAYEKNGNEFIRTGRTISCNNHNALLSNSQVLSGKTGFTGKAGYCYVCQTVINDHPVSFALLACGWPNNKNYKWKDSATIMDYIKNNYKSSEVPFPKLKPETYPNLINAQKTVGADTIKKLPIDYQKNGSLYYLTESDKINYIFNLPKTVEAPVGKNVKIGDVEIYINESLIEVVDVYSLEAAKQNNLLICANMVIDNFFTKCIKINFFPLN